MNIESQKSNFSSISLGKVSPGERKLYLNRVDFDWNFEMIY